MHPKSPTIRAARVAEAAQVWRLTRDAYSRDRARLHPPSGVFKETVADVSAAIARGGVYVAEHDGALLGAVRVQQDQHGTGALYCGRLAVRPSAQRRGIGSTLMRHVESLALAGGYGAVTLGVRLELPENMAFYLKRGYRVVGEEAHPGFTTPTYAWLRKDLPTG
jgi:predicted N-acetyltransferase YhbS